MSNGFQAVQQAIESVYPCLNITCGDIGTLVDGTKQVPLCGAPLAGFFPHTNITEHARIDLDQQDFATRLAAGDFSGALTLYQNGLHSRKGSGLRTLQGFSKSISTSKSDAPLYILFKNYYGSATYADDFVLDALLKRGPFVSLPAVAQQECAGQAPPGLCRIVVVVRGMGSALFAGGRCLVKPLSLSLSLSLSAFPNSEVAGCGTLAFTQCVD